MPLPKIAVLTSIIVTNKNYIYQGGVVVLFDEKRTKNRDLKGRLIEEIKDHVRA